MDTILIIDDEPKEVGLLREMLEEGDFRYLVASSSAEAKALVETRGQRIKAVLLDWLLEGIDGVELMRWLQAHPALADVEIIVQSSEFDPAYIRAGLDCGAYYYLTKPFDTQQLCAIVRAAVATCELKRSLEKRIEETEDAVRLMTAGKFRFRTRKQAEALAVHLGAAAGDSQRVVGLLELLLNAVEHGNLGITYQEKGQLLAEERLEEEIERRLTLSRYRDRRVEVEVERNERQLEILITDAGAGFDFRRYMKMDDERLFHAHGRGVLLASAALELEYIEPGNQVRATLPIVPTTSGQESS